MSYRLDSLHPGDKPRWLELWHAYQEFYRTELTQAATEATWNRLHDGRIRGFAAREDGGVIVGIVHFLFHEDTWSTQSACYLQDLFVVPAARGRGCARRLIVAVAEAAQGAGASSPYWLTHESNATARTLYDRLASNLGFIQYVYRGS